MTKRKVLELLPLLILIGALTYSVIDFDFRVDHFSLEMLAGLGLVVLTILANFFWRKELKTLLGITLILGAFNLIAFLPVNITFGGGLTFNAFGNGFVITFQLFSLLILLLFAYIHRQRLKQLVRDAMKDEPLTEVQLIEKREKKIERFKLQFKHRSIAEIADISRSDIFDKDAVEAAKRLLKERSDPKNVQE